MKKLADVLLIIGLFVIIIGIVTGIGLGYALSDKGINLIITIPVCLLSIIAGGGCISVSGSISEAEENKADDLELLNEIIQKVKEEQ